MRKAARKQKKLDKLQNQAPKLQNISEIIIPKTIHHLNVAVLDTVTSSFAQKQLCLAEQDFESFSQFVANSANLESIFCSGYVGVIQHLSNALKVNTSLRTLQIISYGTEPRTKTDPTLVLPYIGDLLQHSVSLTTLDLTWMDREHNTNDSFYQFINGLKINTTLTKLHVPPFRYRPEHLAAYEVMKIHPNHPELIFPEFDISKDDMKSVSTLVRANILKKAIFKQSYEGTRNEMAPMMEALKETSSLTELSFQFYIGTGNRLTQKECELLADALKVNQSITKLDLKGNGLTSELMSIILDSLQFNKTLTDIKMVNNKLNNDITPSLAAMLAVNESLTEIDLPNYYINAEGCKLIGEALKTNKSVTSLNMFMNPIRLEGCKYLAEGLKFNKTLIRVNLKDCRIDDEGCEYIGKAIKTNPCLLHVDISGHPIKTKGYKALIEGLKENRSLTDLTVSKDHLVPSEIHDEIITLQNKNRQFQRDLIVNTIKLLIQIARSDAFDLFPLEIWLRIFKHFVCGGIPGFNHIAEAVLMREDVQDLKSLCKMRIVRINGKSHLVSKSN